MHIQTAIKKAIKNAKELNAWLYIVKDELDNPSSYEIATWNDLETFFSGLNPRYSIGPNGELL